MTYAKPNLVHVGSAAAVVLGPTILRPKDNVVTFNSTDGDLVSGLDD